MDIREFEKRIRSLALGLVVPGVDLDDLVQEGRIELWRKSAQFDPSRGVDLWTFVHMSVFRRMRDFIRDTNRHRRIKDVSPDTTPDDSANPEILYLGKEKRRCFVLAVLELTEGEQEILARRMDGDGVRAVAEQRGISVGAAHKAIKNAEASLRKKVAA